MRVTLIHNPGAGDHKQPSAGQIEALMKEAGYKILYQSTKEKGWHKALKKSADLVAVAGGDGTVGRSRGVSSGAACLSQCCPWAPRTTSRKRSASRTCR